MKIKSVKFKLCFLMVFLLGIFSALGLNLVGNAFLFNDESIETSSSKLISILVQNEKGEYETYDSNSFPSEGYSFNSQLSYCVNESELSFDSSSSLVTVKAKGSDNCFAYFSLGESCESGDCLYGAILLNEKDGFETISDATSYIENKTTPNFNNVATTDEGLFAVADDNGTSYYYRGAVNDNWVEFAGMYWRIVRVAGDGTVKLIYAGKTIGATEDNTQISTSAFNSSYDSYEYTGYVYAEDELHGTTTDSLIKTNLDSWYKDNLSSYSSHIADTNFCVDRTGYVDAENSTVLNTQDFTGEEDYISYGSRYRLYSNNTPELKCTNQSDLVSSKVGLISLDEAALAGAVWNTTNTDYYLHSGSWYWTLSPYNFSSENAFVGVINASGYLDQNDVSLTTGGVRAVISLKSNTPISGEGTVDNPYKVLS
ncbi:MAG: hypothetical protein R3Y13_04460 [bacterium]